MKINIFKDLNNIFHLFNLLCKNYTKNFSNNIENIHFITFRRFFPDGGACGGEAIQTANKVIFGDKLNNPYHVRSYTYHSFQNALQDFDIIKIYNQISGSHLNTMREIDLTNAENYKFTECFIVICRNIK